MGKKEEATEEAPEEEVFGRIETEDSETGEGKENLQYSTEALQQYEQLAQSKALGRTAFLVGTKKGQYNVVENLYMPREKDQKKAEAEASEYARKMGKELLGETKITKEEYASLNMAYQLGSVD